MPANRPGLRWNWPKLSTTPGRWLTYERADTFTGVILTSVFADSGWFNNAIHATLGSTAGAIAAVMLLVAAPQPITSACDDGSPHRWRGWSLQKPIAGWHQNGPAP